MTKPDRAELETIAKGPTFPSICVWISDGQQISTGCKSSTCREGWESCECHVIPPVVIQIYPGVSNLHIT